jgi:hypothetical protein
MSLEAVDSYVNIEPEMGSISNIVRQHYPMTTPYNAVANGGVGYRIWAEECVDDVIRNKTYQFTDIFNHMPVDVHPIVFYVPSRVPIMVLFSSHHQTRCMLFVGTSHGLGFAMTHFIERCMDFRLCNWLVRDLETARSLRLTMGELISIVSRRELPKQSVINLIRGIKFANVKWSLNIQDFMGGKFRIDADKEDDKTTTCTDYLRRRYESYFSRNVCLYLKKDLHCSPVGGWAEANGSLHDILVHNFPLISTAIRIIYECGCGVCARRDRAAVRRTHRNTN